MVPNGRSSRTVKGDFICWLTVILVVGCLPQSLANAQGSPADTLTTSLLKSRSLEELMEMDITSVSKREEKLFTAAAAIHVITQEEIRRSGATTLPEALRLAPNLNVAQVDSRQWAINARGFNGVTPLNRTGS
ncbi:MAG: TonB-dependent receptor plug domain-containing protein [Ignavibacteria bacterium]|nr:TonB-dependent receptor plug domain-containing protein [Ignavibacteria bacterium]